MKPIYTCIIAIILLFPFKCFLPNASAQSWSWGRAGTVTGCDAWGVATDGSGNVYGAGVRLPSSGAIDFGGGVTSPSAATGSYEVVWVKYDNSGTPLWAGGTTSGNTWLNNITTDPAGNLIVYGFFSSATMQIGSFTLTNALGSGGFQYFLAKISPTGTVLWAINDGSSVTSDGFFLLGSAILSMGGVATDNAGNIYITGSFSNASINIGTYTLTNASSGSYDVFVAKYTASGTVVWASSIGGTATDYGLGVAVASTGDVYVCGAFSSSSITIGSAVITNPYANPIAYIAKFSPTGVPLWGQAAGGANGAFAVGLQSDNYGNVYMTGGFKNVSISFGATTVTRTYTTSGAVHALYLVQYSPADIVTWSKTIGSPTQGVWGFCIAMASCGQVWVSGNYSEAADIDGHTLALVPGADPIFIAGYNLTGGVVGYSGLGSGADDQNGIACDRNGNVFICSDYRAASITIGPDVLPAPASPEGFFVGKYANSIVAPDTIFTHQDTAYCGIDSIILKAPTGYSNYYWSDSSSDSTLKIGAAGTYWVFCVTCGDTTLADTFHVAIIPSDTNLIHTDTSVCFSAGSATLIAPPGYTTYLWNTGSAASSIVVSTAGTYYVKALSGCSLLVDTFNVTITPNDTTHTHSDTSVCSSIGVLPLIAPGGYTTYLWNTGSSATFITVSSTGRYIVYCTTGCNVLIDTFNVTFLRVPVVNLGNDTSFCAGNTLTLSSTQPPGSTFLWNTGSTSNSIVVSSTGLYKLNVTNSVGCPTADSILVTISPLPVVNLGNDTAVCTGIYPTLQSSVTYPAGTTYTWNTGATTPSIVANVIGTYWLQVTVGGCMNSDTIVVKNLFDTLNFPMIDTAICRGNKINVRATGTPGMTYQWRPTAGIALSTIAATVIIPDTSAMYYLTASISTCPDIIDSFYIDVQPNPVVFVGNNEFVCKNDTLHLHASVTPSWYSHYIYRWKPGLNLDDTTTSTVVFTPGDTTTLTLTVTTPAGCKSVDSILVFVYPPNLASLDTMINLCPHDSATLIPKSVDPGTTFRWHPALYMNDTLSSQPIIRPITNQAYWAVVTSKYGCLDTIYASVSVRSEAVINLGDSVMLYPGESYQIPVQTNCVSFAWFPPAGLNNAFISDPVATPQLSTKYIVQGATEWGCKAVDSISIYVSEESLIDVPNAFTPGNGPNGSFKLIKRGIATLNFFRIFNRWGNMVYESNNIDAGWDGSYKGTPQPYDVYVYQVEAVTNTGKIFHKHGNVTLVR